MKFNLKWASMGMGAIFVVFIIGTIGAIFTSGEEFITFFDNRFWVYLLKLNLFFDVITFILFGVAGGFADEQ